MAYNFEIDDYVVTSDKYNVILNKRTVDKKGEDILKPLGYFGDLDTALRHLKKNYIQNNDKDIETAEQLEAVYLELEGKFDDALMLM